MSEMETGLDPKVLEAWRKQPATKIVLDRVDAMTSEVIPRPDRTYSADYGNWAFGFFSGFKAAVDLFRAAAMEPPEPGDMILEEDFGIAATNPSPQANYIEPKQSE